MLGDSAAMLVDVMTYAFNFFAERRKQSAGRKTLLMLELIPPMTSVIILVTITIFILRNAIITLVHGNSKSDNDEPSVTLMFIVSVINLFIDIGNVGFFAKAKHAFGYATIHTDGFTLNSLHNDGTVDDEIIGFVKKDGSSLHDFEDDMNTSISDGESCCNECEHTAHEANLNMCSAYTVSAIHFLPVIFNCCNSSYNCFLSIFLLIP